MKAGVLGSGSFKARIPNDPSLIGTKVYTQFTVEDKKANNLGLTFTNAVETTIGGFK